MWQAERSAICFMSDKPKTKAIWLSGGYLARKAMSDNIRKKFEDQDLVEIDSECHPEWALAQFQTKTVFAEKRLVVFREFPNIGDSNKKRTFLNKLKKVLSEIDDTTFVLFNGIDKDKEKALFTVFSDVPNNKLYEYDLKLSPSEAPHWLKNRAQKLGYDLPFEAATALAENGGFDKDIGGINVDRLELAMQRLMLYAGERKELTKDDVSAIMFEFDNFVIWDLTNALDARDYEKCVSLSNKFYILDENMRSAVMQMMSTMLWRYRLMLFLKDRQSCTKDSVDSHDIVFKQASEMRKLSTEGSGLSVRMVPDVVKTGDNAGQTASLWNSQTIQMYLNGMYGRDPILNKYSRRDIYRGFVAIQETLTILRTTDITDEDALLLANLFFGLVCNQIDDTYSKRIRMSMLERY